MSIKRMNAKLKRLAKEIEKKERAAFEAGQISPGTPKSSGKRRKAAAAVREAQKEESRFLNRSAAETAQLTHAELIADVQRLHDLAYARYYALMQQGTPNAATSIYETEFAGLDPWHMTVNALRAMAHKLRRWLKRKDVSPKRAARGQNKTLEYLREHGFPDVSAEDLPQFFDMLSKYHEIYGGYNRYAIQYFAAAYAAEIDNPLENMEAIFSRTNDELRREYERNNGTDTFGGLQLSPAGGLQSPDAPGFSTPDTKRPRPSHNAGSSGGSKRKAPKNKRRADAKRRAEQKARAMAARKKNARKKN